MTFAVPGVLLFKFSYLRFIFPCFLFMFLHPIVHLNYFNGCISDLWDCHIYNLAFAIRVISDYDILAAISLSGKTFSTTFITNWHILQHCYLFVLCDSLWFVSVPFVNCLDVIALAHVQFDVWCCIIMPLNVFRFGKFWGGRSDLVDRLIKWNEGVIIAVV